MVRGTEGTRSKRDRLMVRGDWGDTLKGRQYYGKRVRGDTPTERDSVMGRWKVE